MKRIKLFCLFSFALLQTGLWAQKSAPVAGDAARLTDLLKKDYSSLDPSVFDDEFKKDRSVVIATLKTYLTEEQKNVLKTDTVYASTEKTEITEAYTKYSEAKSKLDGLLKVSSTAPQFVTSIEEASSNLDEEKKKLIEVEFIKDILELKSIESSYANELNPYLSDMTVQFLDKYRAVQNYRNDLQAHSNNAVSQQKALPFLGGDLVFETVMDGLSKFIAKRVKEELTAAVIERVQEWLKKPGENDPLAELKILLPRTNEYLLAFNADQAANFPNEIKQYIEDDFNHTLDNISGLRDTPRMKRLALNYPDIDLALEALELVPILSKIKEPADYFRILENSRCVNKWKESADPVKFNIANTFLLAGMLANSYMISENGQSRFAGTEFIGNYSTDLDFYLLYVGFLRQQNVKYYNIHFKIRTAGAFNLTVIHRPGGRPDITNQPDTILTIPLGKALDSLMYGFSRTRIEQVQSDRKFFENMFVSVGKHSEKVYASALDIKKANKKGDRIGADTIYTFIKSTVGLAEEITATADTFVNYMLKKCKIVNTYLTNVTIDSTGGRFSMTLTPGPPVAHSPAFHLKEKAAPYFQVAYTTNDIVLDLQKKNYATAIIKTLELTSKTLPGQLNKSLEALDQLNELKGLQAELVKTEWNAEAWSHVFNAVLNAQPAANMEIKKDLARAAVIVYAETGKIKDFYFTRYQVDRTTATNLAVFSGYVSRMQQHGTSISFPNPTELAAVKGLLRDPAFGYVLISYYCGNRLDLLAQKLENDMINFTVMSNGVEVHLFTPAEADSLRTDLLLYTQGLYQYLVTNNTAQLEVDNKIFRNTVENYFLRLPEKFEFKLNDNTLHLIHFINDIAVAKNSDDMEKAFEAFALPSGSYSLKRKSKFNASITTFPGILPAAELTKKNRSTYLGFSYAFTVPVGINLAWGSKKGFSNGLFISMIDLGAVTKLHLTNELKTDSTTTDILPKLTFNNVFAPGLYYSLGLKKTPLSFLFGAQYGPGLREVDKNGNAKIYESVRFGAGLVLDIPLFNIYTKARFD